MKPYMPFIFLVLIALMLALALLMPHANTRTGYAIEPFSIPILSEPGETLTQNSWKGKIVMINVFASWCVPCAVESTALMKLAAAHKIDIIGIAWKDDPEKTKDFLEERGNPYNTVGVDVRGKTTLKLGLTGVPETLILDKNGIVAYHYPAGLSDDMIDSDILPLIEKLEHGQ